ncbi:hypothetical protein BU24DRAFT_425034 [Aaosphaeria arxii CBS 175.79]|uniref:F-box domain-containing protein n=1 Tax=Aaosphaeria arxii CBS 175.79 TaxID=1450172 RepID=A0A6A5XMQ6_9PLEO|nr:uncharacterized protein BU24DRAFT_425034 [Aaosphaeria arxii CBS 175.79]KAF2014030.1 hypothetical protein BU24DRAFT_425034 [Aaosphaeria arxii CBS 175.79]
MVRMRHSPDRHSLRISFNDLPDDVLIIVCSQCQLDELLALRLTTFRIRNLIDHHLATIAPAVGRSSLPLAGLLNAPLPNRSCYTIEWLKALIPRQLAAILVDRHRSSVDGTQLRYGIPAEDPFGEELRERVANGWCVLRRLSRISEQVYDLDPRLVLKSSTDLAWKVVNPARFKFELFRQREDLVLTRRLAYVEELPSHLARDYRLMFMLLSSAFRTSVSNYGDDYKPWVFDWGCGIDGQRLLRRGNSWLTWFLLNEGPDLFWQQWQMLPADEPNTKNYIRDRSIETWFGKNKADPEDFIRQFLAKEWEDVNEKWHNIQRDHAQKVHRAMEEKATKGMTDFASTSPIVYFTQYAEVRRQRELSGLPPVAETLSHVPFHIDFRCPEELFQKFCALRQEKASAIANPSTARN